MNIILWVLQIVLALLCLAGGAYKVFAFQVVPMIPSTSALPRAGWTVLGVFEIVCGLLLVIPGATHWMPGLTPLAAAALTLESLALAAMYARYSLALVATNPLVYVVPMAVFALLVAWGRYTQWPL
ncbi:MAG TPA: hypothetical protein VGL65_14195 [Gemmatimonadales bacterium]|jgi:hypothetical protein